MNYVIWTARLAVMLYLVGLGLRFWKNDSKLSQVVWTVGFFVFLVHVWAAFEYVHQWSHTAAWQHTAEQTGNLTGWYWGGGIWFNYLFLIVWGIDVAVTWKTKWPVRAFIAVHGYLAFIVLNATAVFGPTWWRAVMLIAGVALGGMIWKNGRVKPDKA